MLFAAIAILWLAATAVALVAVRWRPARRPSHAAAAALLWLAPTALLLTLPWVGTEIPRAPAAVLLSAGTLFGLAAPALRRYYSRATQSARLGLGLLALVTPPVAAYPLASVIAEETTERAIQTVYSPATARHPEELRQGIARAQREVDALGRTRRTVARTPPGRQPDGVLRLEPDEPVADARELRCGALRSQPPARQSFLAESVGLPVSHERADVDRLGVRMERSPGKSCVWARPIDRCFMPNAVCATPRARSSALS